MAKKAKPLQVFAGKKVTSVVIPPSALFRVLECRRRKGWETMYEIPHSGAQIHIDKMKVSFRKDPIFAVRIRSGKQVLRTNQKCTEDQKIVKYGKATKTEQV